jgi:formylmethanofuran dehydrogenase subunit C
MRRGLIAIGGNAGGGLGAGMVAGSVFVFGGVGRYPGMGMKRGTIALFGDGPADLLPSFAPSGVHRFPFLTIYLRRLAAWGYATPGGVFAGLAERYNGDLADGGLGEILVGRGAR